MRILCLLLLISVLSSPVCGEMDVTRCSDFPFAQLKGSGTSIPPFYYWRRAYRLKGKGGFKAFFVQEDGTQSPVTLAGERVDPKLASLVAQGSSTGYDPRYIDVDHQKKFRSKDEKWEVYFTYAPPLKTGDQEVWHFCARNVQTGKSMVYPISNLGFGPTGFHYWDNSRDLFYTSVDSGSTTDRATNLLLFDPKDFSFKRVCNTHGRIFFSQDGTWMIWESGRWLGSLGGRNFWITNLFAFNCELRKNFVIAQGAEIDLFNRWK